MFIPSCMHVSCLGARRKSKLDLEVDRLVAVDVEYVHYRTPENRVRFNLVLL